MTDEKDNLDAVQVEILCLPFKDGTIIGLGGQSFTAKVAGFGGFIAHKIGRRQMAIQIRPMFEALQRKFRRQAKKALSSTKSTTPCLEKAL